MPTRKHCREIEQCSIFHYCFIIIIVIIIIIIIIIIITLQYYFRLQIFQDTVSEILKFASDKMEMTSGTMVCVTNN